MKFLGGIVLGTSALFLFWSVSPTLDGKSFQDENFPTRQMFVRTWGDGADWQWRHEHNLELIQTFIKYPRGR